MPSFQVGDKFFCFGYGQPQIHICRISYVGTKNVDLKWYQGYGSEIGWTVMEIEGKISSGQWIKYSPVLAELYE